MTTDARKVLNYIVARADASETQPLRLGNVSFWHAVPGFGVGLCYDKPTHKWDVGAVQADINKHASEYWDDLVAHIQA